MQSLGLPPAVLVEALPIDVPVGDQIKHYEIPPISARDFWRLKAADVLWGQIGRGRLKELTQAPPEEVADAATKDPGVQAAIVELLSSEWTAQDVSRAALGYEVADQMLADGVLNTWYQLAAATAMAWHLTGDRDAAKQVWAGENPGNRAARRQKNSTSTARASGVRRASGNGTSSRKTSKKG